MSLDILCLIVKGNIQGMSMRDWLKAIAVFSARDVVSFASSGWALVIN